VQPLTEDEHSGQAPEARHVSGRTTYTVCMLTYITTTTQKADGVSVK